MGKVALPGTREHLCTPVDGTLGIDSDDVSGAKRIRADLRACRRAKMQVQWEGDPTYGHTASIRCPIHMRLLIPMRMKFCLLFAPLRSVLFPSPDAL